MATVLLLAPTLSIAETAKTIRVVSDHWPGYTEPGAKGFYFDLIKRIYEPMGYAIEHRIVPFRRAINLINSGEADLFLADDHPKYLSKLDAYQLENILHPEHPINYSLVTAVFAGDSNHDWQAIRNNSELHLAWVKGYGYGKTLSLPHKHVMHVNNTTQGLRLLQAGRIDSFIDDLTDIKEALKLQEFAKLHINREIVNKRNLYPLFHNRPSNIALVDIYNQSMSKLIESGEILALYQTVGIDYRDTLKPKEYFSAVYDSHPSEGLSILIDGLESL